MGKIFFFVSSNVVYNDKVLPIILELARQWNSVDTIIINHQGHKYLCLVGAYYDWLKKFTRIRKVNIKRRLF